MSEEVWVMSCSQSVLTSPQQSYTIMQRFFIGKILISFIFYFIDILIS